MPANPLKYTYLIDPWTNHRVIAAGDDAPDGDNPGFGHFRPITFTPQELGVNTPPDAGFTPTPLDVLVNLYTRADTPSILHSFHQECPHKGPDSCDCPPPKMQIKSLLALHAVTLRRRLDTVTIGTTSQREDIVDHWYQQGVALHHALVAILDAALVADRR